MIRHVLPGVTLAVGLLATVSLVHDWRPARSLARAWRRYGSLARWNLSTAPATFVYLAILWVTTWVLLGMPAGAREAFLSDQSTNLAHLTSDPLRVLVRSAFFVTGEELLAWTVLFSAVLAPAERWLGTGRAIAVFAIGHVGASALSAVDIWIHIRYLHAPASLWDDTDTGASHGFFAVAAVLAARLRGWSRVLLVAVLAGVVVFGAIGGTGFTARGHALSVLIGAALAPLARRPEVRERVGRGRSLVSLWRRRSADGPAHVGPADITPPFAAI